MPQEVVGQELPHRLFVSGDCSRDRHHMCSGDFNTLFGPSGECACGCHRDATKERLREDLRTVKSEFARAVRLLRVANAFWYDSSKTLGVAQAAGGEAKLDRKWHDEVEAALEEAGTLLP